MPSLRLALPILVLLVSPAAGQPEVSPACHADLNAVDDSFGETLERLDKAATGSDAEKCAAYLHHVEVMEKGVEVFKRCIPEGRDQDENVLQLLVSIEDFHYIIENKCPKQ